LTSELPTIGRRVVLGVTGGIAAYKSVEVARRLVELGLHVSPVMTDDATRFVGETTFSALASEPVQRSLFGGADPIPHTHLGQRADIVVVAPATARFLAAYACGLADDLLTATLLATRAKVLVCPAMHAEMWEHPAVQENLAILRRRGVEILEPSEGRLAGGDVGPGRMAEPGEIVERVMSLLPGASPGARHASLGAPGASSHLDLAGVKVLVTAGGTREPIDAVRVITNRSSGRQGHVLAQAAEDRGAEVLLVTTAELPGPPSSEVVSVETAAEMEQAVLARAGEADVVVMAAAVADFRPKDNQTRKIPKADGVPEIVLEATPDILSELGRRRRPGQVLVGFAAETGDLEERAAAKLETKSVDLMVANDVSRPGVGFDHETNAVTILSRDGSRRQIPLSSKRVVADAVLDAVVTALVSMGGLESGDPAHRTLKEEPSEH
jgi:phosphopantothenoylcysteine decarboxylase/phosphopantothenate--cysteine ligase